MFDEPTPALYIHIPPQKISHVRYGGNFFLVSRTVSQLLRLYPISAASSRFCLHDISFASYHNPEARGLWLRDGGILFTVAHSSPARLDTHHGFRFRLAACPSCLHDVIVIGALLLQPRFLLIVSCFWLQCLLLISKVLHVLLYLIA